MKVKSRQKGYNINYYIRKYTGNINEVTITVNIGEYT